MTGRAERSRGAESEAERAVVARAEQSGREAAEAVGRAISAARAEAVAAADTRARARSGAEREHVARMAQVHTTAAQMLDSLRLQLGSITSGLAPGLAGAPWTDPAWQDAALDAQTAVDAVRLGVFGAAGTPANVAPIALAPLLNGGNLVIHANDAQAEDAIRLLRQVALRHLASVVPGQVKLAVFDPALRGDFARFSGLRKGESLIAKPLNDPEDLQAHLAELADHVSEVSDVLGSHPTLGELQAASGQPIEAYRLLVVLDYPSCLSQRAHDDLQRIARRGPRCGVSVLLHHDPSAKPTTDYIKFERNLPNSTEISATADGWTLTSFADGSPVPLGGSIVPDQDPPAELYERISAAVADASKASSTASFSFAEIMPAQDALWSLGSAENLQVIVGKSGLEHSGFTLGDSREQLNNALVGGAVGQGKSNLLLVLIHGLAARYSPAELRMYLLDFKEGLEFSSLGPDAEGRNWLPHAEVLGLESDQEFGLSVLAHLVAEFERRSALFTAAKARNLMQFREARPDVEMPRLLVLIDEFQGLFTGNEDVSRKAVAMLDTLARKGRAYGIHLVLASQTLSGIPALVSREESIFSQFAVRIALKTSASESQVLLSQGNSAASELRFRGEAVLNTDFGSKAGNRRVTVARADDALLAGLRDELWAKAEDPVPPLVFSGAQLASLPSAYAFEQLLENRGTEKAVRQAWVGMPVAVTTKPTSLRLEAEPGRHIALVGEGLEEAVGMLHASALTLAAQHEPGRARFVILDLLAASQAQVGQVAELAQTLRAFGHEVMHHTAESTNEAFAELDRQLESPSGDTTYLLGFGMHRAPGLVDKEFGATFSAIDVLRKAIGRGPTAGVHVVAWWGAFAQYRQQIESDFSISKTIQSYGLLRLPRDDASSIVGAFNSWVPRERRALAWDKSLTESGELIVPFAPLSADELARIRERVSS